MSKFEVADTVAVYGHKSCDWKRKTGKVIQVDCKDATDGMNVLVQIDGIRTYCHPKQLRRVRKRKRRRIFVSAHSVDQLHNAKAFGGEHNAITTQIYLKDNERNPELLLEFVEVRGRK